MVDERQDERFTACLRVRRAADFERVYARKVHAADSMLVLNAVQNEQTYTRLGLSVSRAVGGAVVRNRWKRLIRDAFRRRRAELPTGLDIVARPRRGARPNQAAIGQSLVRLAAQLARKVTRG